MLNDVWLKMAEFLGRLNGESASRESYVRTPEYEKALEAWKEKEQEWEDFLETLSAGQREELEEIKECQEDFSSAQELRAYGICFPGSIHIQGRIWRPGKSAVRHDAPGCGG